MAHGRISIGVLGGHLVILEDVRSLFLLRVKRDYSLLGTLTISCYPGLGDHSRHFTKRL